jgi:hypothetical protein
MRLRSTTPLILLSGLSWSLAGSIHAGPQVESPSAEKPLTREAYGAPDFVADLGSVAPDSAIQETEAFSSQADQVGQGLEQEPGAGVPSALGSEAQARLESLLSGPVPVDLEPRLLQVLVSNAELLGPARVRDFLDAVGQAGDELAAWSRLARTELVAVMDARPGPIRVAAVQTLEELMVAYPGTEIGDRAEALHFKLTRLARGCMPPWFTVLGPLGNEVRSTDLLGQVVIVRIMGPDDVAERAALRNDLTFSREHWDDPLTMVSISTEPDRRKLHGMLEAAQVHWPVSWEPEGSGGLLDHWRLDGQSSYVIGPNGRIAGVDLSRAELEVRLQWLWNGGAEQVAAGSDQGAHSTDVFWGEPTLPHQPTIILPTTPFSVGQTALPLTSGAAPFQRIRRSLRYVRQSDTAGRLREIAKRPQSSEGNARYDG